MRKITKRSAAIAVATVVAVGGAGAAWAYWTSTGTATVTATAGSAKPLEVTTAAVVGDALVPGGKASVQFTVKNTNGYTVAPTTLSLTGFQAVSSAACDGAATFQQVANAALPGNWGKKIAAGETATYTWTNAVELSANPDDDCQGQAYKFTVNVGSTSSSSTNVGSIG